MLRTTIGLLIIALVAGLLGFTGVAAGAMVIAKVTFFVFLVLAVATFIASLLRGSPVW